MNRGEEFKGISQHHADELLKTYGKNEIRNINTISPIKILWHQIRTNYVIYLLLVALTISFIVGKYPTAYTILGVIIIVITVGFFMEYKAEKAIDALKNMITPMSIVLRDGKETEIPTINIVPGDIVILRTGDRIPADCLVLDEKELRINESILTGESKEIRKIATKNLALNHLDKENSDNTIFMGTFITSGKCVAKVIHTGMNTKFGSIANMISSAEKELPLQAKINTIIKYIVILGITFSTISGIIMLIQSDIISYKVVIEILVVVLALCVASFPEGFPVVLISILAYGTYRMAQKNAIVNRMSIIETLGETTVICADKTGTITTGAMTVKKIFVDNKLLDVSGAGYSGIGEILYNNKKVDSAGSKTLYKLLLAGILCNDSRIERKGEDQEYLIYGSPTEAALLIMATKAKMYSEDIKHKRIEEMPFSSESKMMTVLVNEKDSNIIYSKGAPEVIIKKCRYIMLDGKKVLLTKRESEKILKQVKELSSNSYRTMALAYKDARSEHIKDISHNLILLGIVGMEDPPRPEVKESVQMCQTAGIKVKIITGDSKETAEAIAREIGLKGETLSGQELDLMTDEELTKVVDKIVIFVRVKPEHKLRIVHALKFNGEIVTMTGDGVNDAPALKEAHIGVAMGKNGTDVSREASDLILKDDRFSTIVDAVKEGRTIFNNIQKYSIYQISINVAQVMLILMSVLLGLPLPLVAIQILFMNIISDEITAITLAFNTPSKDVMTRPPRRKSEIITGPLKIFTVIAGVLMTIGAVGLFYIISSVYNEPLSYARTTTFVIMTLFAIVNAFNFRSFRKLTTTRSLLVNKYLFYASLVSIIITIIIIYTPINKVFELSPLGWTEWVMAILLAVLYAIIMDIIKVLNNKYEFIDKLSNKYLKS